MTSTPLLTHDLRSAVAGRRLEVVYQPIFALDDWASSASAPSAVEALSRWKHAAMGDVSPTRFIPLAQRAGFLEDLDRLVLAVASAQFTRWRRSGHEIGLSVNASPTHFAGDYVSAVLERAEALAAPPGALTVEIIELPPPQLIPDMEGALVRLRDAGVAVSVDDFGAGDTTIGMLDILPIDEVKIDRSLTQRADAAADDIVRSVVERARAGGWRVVAEGIETAADLQRARDRGCHRGQGFLLGRPLPGDGVARMLARTE
ncbi:EAL domain-containing protein [Microbacterium sp. HD4P20]|uniref:EAL domain-containing protein n=1 Tax=Microbacterium sp. HD4P20 TaxID=2864874 RepID=UPI001C642287|nr:EAL domain-containing protein [Microbacterium sp. HD4P20]MCP2635825.1 EAL domain-containing protein [Microbacterium sp. HD4P20]